MIFISAGHHQKAKGASYKNIAEFDETVLWQKKIAMYLDPDTFILVPSGRLGDKICFINEQILASSSGPHIAIEIHFNMAWKDTDEDGEVDIDEYLGRGSETLYYPNSHNGKHLAEMLQAKLSIIYGPNRGAKEGWYQMNPAKGPDRFLSKTNCPALIIEPEFIHNYEKIVEGRLAGCKIIADTLKTMMYGD